MSCLPFKILKENQQCPPYDGQGDTTVGDTNFKAHFPTVSKSMAWSTLKPLITQAISKYISPYVCKEVICCVVEKWNEDENSLNDTEKEFLELLQNTAAYYAIYHGYPLINAFVSDVGVQESITEGSAPVSLWRYKNSRGYICNFADDCLDQLLCFLEDLPEKDPLKQKWSQSKCCRKPDNCFFKKLCDFEKYVDLKNSGRTFRAIIPHMKKSVKQCLKPIMCGYLDELCDNIHDDDLSPAEKKLLELIKPLLAYHTMSIAMPHLRIIIENDGIKMISSSDGVDSKNPAYHQAINVAKCGFEDDVTLCKKELIKFLYDNAEDFPTWKESDCYVEKTNHCPTVRGSDCGAIIL